MCGVIGVFAAGRDTFDEVVAGLFQMQHRGQDACGIAMADGDRFSLHKATGLVKEVFGLRPEAMQGSVACGHVRYPTQGGNRACNAQPHLIHEEGCEPLALSSNGDVTNYGELRAEYEARGVTFAGSNDAELILRMIVEARKEGATLLDAIRFMQRTLRGAYSVCMVSKGRLWGIRDLYAVRPLSLGRLEDGWMLASETTAIDINRGRIERELEPGEVVEISEAGCSSHLHPDLVALRGGRTTAAHCSFEHVYFSRPDAKTFGLRVYEARKRMGAWLADRDTTPADVVVPVPDSSTAVALGYAQRRGIPFEFGLVRNHYVGRTFISPTQERRDEGVRFKFNPNADLLEGRRVILVDDSIVRGTTLRKIVRMVRNAGAAEVHLRIGSPVTRHSCFYGVDTPDEASLIGNRLDAEGIREHLTADSLQYMTVEGLRSCLDDRGQFCMACFDGNYPIALSETKQAMA
jgi:amidophosphoribosyltransferase